MATSLSHAISTPSTRVIRLHMQIRCVGSLGVELVSFIIGRRVLLQHSFINLITDSRLSPNPVP